MQPVDEALDKKLFIHTVSLTFMQVRGLDARKDFLFPQLPPQAVHKEEQVVHRLSTGVDKAPLGAFPAADYRCGIPEFLGAKTVFLFKGRLTAGLILAFCALFCG